MTMNEGQPPPWPRHLRGRARCYRRTLLALREELLAWCPRSEALVRDSTLAERIETTPYDHDAARALAALEPLIDALEDIESTK